MLLLSSFNNLQALVLPRLVSLLDLLLPPLYRLSSDASSRHSTICYKIWMVQSAHPVAVQSWWVFETPSTSVASSSGGSLVSSISIWVSINTFKILGQRLSIWF
ncbi:hypothetical protein L6452_25843 [Arctium lappa]|uniref:Uncharacterized protein n=1 Tax=Arctium lappa TaxID=4217 RepID=A0ACB9ACY5_ARCLA|nr:hypothetical protein L6452_25843 [Arctium lappa]